MRLTAFRRCLWSCLPLLVVGLADADPQPLEVQRRGSGLLYEVHATDARLNRRVMGPVIRSVQGVPAEPVDSFVYDGVGSVPIDGELHMTVDPVRGTGELNATWTDAHGKWTYRQTRFVHPEHLSGVRLSSSMAHVDSVLNDPIVQNVYLHGDTTAGMPVVPTVFALLATWGPADVTLNDRPFENPFELPAPQWEGHSMVTEGVRWSDGTVRTLSGEIYSPSQSREGAVEPGDLEAHLAFHDHPFPMTTSFPPLHSFTYHLVFEEVSIRIVHVEPQDPALTDEPKRPRPARKGLSGW